MHAYKSNTANCNFAIAEEIRKKTPAAFLGKRFGKRNVAYANYCYAIAEEYNLTYYRVSALLKGLSYNSSSGGVGERHHKAKLKDVDVLRWRSEYIAAGRPWGWIMKAWKASGVDISYNCFKRAVSGRNTWQVENIIGV